MLYDSETSKPVMGYCSIYSDCDGYPTHLLKEYEAVSSVDAKQCTGCLASSTLPPLSPSQAVQ